MLRALGAAIYETLSASALLRLAGGGLHGRRSTTACGGVSSSRPQSPVHFDRLSDGSCCSCCRPIMSRRHRRNMSNERLYISRFVPRRDWSRRNWCPSTTPSGRHAIIHTIMHAADGREDTDGVNPLQRLQRARRTSVRVANAAAADMSASV